MTLININYIFGKKVRNLVNIIYQEQNKEDGIKALLDVVVVTD